MNLLGKRELGHLYIDIAHAERLGNCVPFVNGSSLGYFADHNWQHCHHVHFNSHHARTYRRRTRLLNAGKQSQTKS
jgi:hypothetical protein